VRQLAEALAGGLGSKDYLSEALSVYYFVIANTRYMRDPRTVELVRAPHIVVAELAQGKTPSLDCDDMASLIVALLLAMGNEVRIVTVAFHHAFHRGKRQFSHVFVQAREPRTRMWITLDPVAAEKTAQMLRRVKAAKIWPVA
jgi:transglutaminase-like putative cysteine protease